MMMESNSVELSEPKGIGGWLIVVAIGLIITPIRLAYTIIVNFIPTLNSNEWGTLNFPAFKALFYSELIANTLIILFAIVLLALFFSKCRQFPKLMIAYYIINVTFVIADYLVANYHPLIHLVSNLEGSITEVVPSILAAAIWIPYFLVSKRVKNTFV